MEGIVNVNNYLKMTVGSLCLIMLIICIAFNLTENMDASIYQLLHRTMSSEIIVQYLTMISTVFSPIACLCMVLIILLGLLIYDRFKCVWYGFWCFSVFAIGTFLKYAIQRPRPSAIIDGYSFPSMHVLSVCILVSLIVLLAKHKAVIFIGAILILSIMISRIYLQAHYFTDTIASLCVLYILIQTLYIEFETKGIFSVIFKKVITLEF